MRYFGLLLAFTLCGCAHAQQSTNLPTPVVILPLPNHSAAGQLIFRDKTNTSVVTLQEATANRLALDVPGGSNGGAALTITTANTGAAAEGLLVIAPTTSDKAADFDGKTTVLDNSSGLALSITQQGSGGTVQIVSNTHTATNAALYIDASVSAPFGTPGIWIKGDIAPFGDNAYNLGGGPNTDYWKNVLSYNLTAKALIASKCVETGAGGILSTAELACVQSIDAGSGGIAGALTLSGGTGITVGSSGSTITVTNSQPFSQTAWSTWAPTVGNMTGTPATNCAYKQVGKTAWIACYVIGASNGNNPNITLPFVMQDQGRTTTAGWISQGGIVSATVEPISPTQLSVGVYNNTALAAALTSFKVSGVIETQ